MFLSNMAESKQSEVTLRGLDAVYVQKYSSKTLNKSQKITNQLVKKQKQYTHSVFLVLKTKHNLF